MESTGNHPSFLLGALSREDTGTVGVLRGDVSFAHFFRPRLKQKPPDKGIDDIIHPLILGSWFEIASPFVGLAFLYHFSNRSIQEAIVDFLMGDPVIHWTYGLGKIVRQEERTFSGEKKLYYVVQIRDLTIWVPADGKVMSRLRPPTPENEFSKLFAILSGPGESLLDDRLERKTQLVEELKEGKAEAICRVIRDLSFYQQRKPLNDNDKLVLKQASDSLLGEWGFSLSIPLAQAQVELYRLLVKPSQNVAG